ncbi:MAG: endonuclease/exonuclease/phosphatase family protein [Acidobacteriaceae bacterium]|nr:endonuclease/exonuclease/phosphatase family protein [Acidobacteriaceae bacterium]
MAENRCSCPAVLPNLGAQSEADQSISAASLNLAKEPDADKVLRTIFNTPRLRDTDLFLFQEVVNEGSNSSVAEEIAGRLGYSAGFEPAPSSDYDQGLAVVSRYPITSVQTRRLKACDLRFRSRNRFAMRATLQTPWSDLRVWNVHLDTRINAEQRLNQLRPVIDEASRDSRPQLIGGDFNTNELYWLRNIVPVPGGPSHGPMIRNAMKEHGFETPFAGTLNTFPALGRHLDWIFLRDLTPVETSVQAVPFSDHNAIWVRFRF